MGERAGAQDRATPGGCMAPELSAAVWSAACPTVHDVDQA